MLSLLQPIRLTKALTKARPSSGDFTRRRRLSQRCAKRRKFGKIFRMVASQRRRRSSINPVDRISMLTNVKYLFVWKNALYVFASFYPAD